MSLVFQSDTIRLRFLGESCAARIIVAETLEGARAECSSQVVGVKTSSYHAAHLIQYKQQLLNSAQTAATVRTRSEICVRTGFIYLVPDTYDDIYCPDANINRRHEVVPSTRNDQTRLNIKLKFFRRLGVCTCELQCTRHQACIKVLSWDLPY